MLSGMAKLGVWCFESAWSSNPLYRGSVEPVLELMGRERRIRYEHDRVRRLSQLQEALDQWIQKRSFPVGYLALHGDTGTVFVGRKELSLDTFGEQLAGRCSEKVIVFAGCRTFLGSEEKLTRLAGQLDARAVCGYTKSVDHMQAAAFELLLIDWLAQYDRIARIDAPFRSFGSRFGDLVDYVGFRAVSRDGSLLSRTSRRRATK